MADTVLVLGSGPIRIGQGIEFDYSCVHSVWTLRSMGYRATIVNNNPETVSTDFDTSDGLYFEPITIEDVMDVIGHEPPIGVVCQFGGQTAINLAQPLVDRGIKLIGTSAEAIAMAEDRAQFDALLGRLGLARPAGKAVTNLEDAVRVAAQVGYPVLVRPSFVLGGRAMEILYSESRLREFFSEAAAANPGQPVLVDQYLLGKEIEVDLVSDGETVLIPGIMEHIERAGVHSGDSMAIYPPISVSAELTKQIIESSIKIARALAAKGLVNIQFVVSDGVPYVLEVNPRGSRTVPFLSKVTGLPMVDLATRAAIGVSLSDLGYASGLWKLGHGEGHPPTCKPGERFASIYQGRVLNTESITEADLKSEVYAVKAPVFSFQKLAKVEPSLGPEMKSTGEVMGVDRTYEGALYKALVGAGINFKGKGAVCLTLQDLDKDAGVEIARQLQAAGREVVATPGTAAYFQQRGVACTAIGKIQDGSPNLLELIMDGGVSLMINTPGATEASNSEAARIRRACIETGVACVTSIDTAAALVRVIELYDDPSHVSCDELQSYFPKA